MATDSLGSLPVDLLSSDQASMFGSICWNHVLLNTAGYLLFWGRFLANSLLVKNVGARGPEFFDSGHRFC